jgi:hypothetical protein
MTAILPSVGAGRRLSTVAVPRVVLAALALALAPASAVGAAPPVPPPNPAVLPQVVGQAAGGLLDPQLLGGVPSWVADPGPGLPRALMATIGGVTRVTFQETVRGAGPLAHLGGFPVPLAGVEVGAASGIAAALDPEGVRVATIAPNVAAAYAVASLAPTAPPVLSGVRLVATGAASGLVVQPGGVFWTQGGALFVYRPSPGDVVQVAPIPAGSAAEGADVSGSTVIYARAGARGSTLVRQTLGGSARVLLTSPGLLQGPVIAGGWAVARERRAFGAVVIDRIVAVHIQRRTSLVLMQRWDTRAGRVFLEAPRAEGNRVVVVQTFSRKGLGKLVLHPSAASLPTGLRSSVRVIALPGSA